MRLALALFLFVPGLLLLATPGLPAGLALMWAGWWVYERSGLRGDEGFIALLQVLGAVGALAEVARYAGGW